MQENWDLIVKPKTNIFSLNFKEVWRYKDLIFLLVKRDLISGYKQTVLGPFWVIAQPLMATVMFTFTFSRIAGLQTQGIPAFLYYLTGLTFWSFFSDSVTKNANTFAANSSIFGKVYFPRLVMPLSVMFSNLFKLGIQFSIYLCVWIYFIIADGSFTVHPKAFILLPFVIIILGTIGLSFGLIITSMTTKYRDFNFFIAYAVQFLMYLSCVVLALPAKGMIHDLLMYNPIVPLIEAIKYIFLGVGQLSYYHLFYSFIFCMLSFFYALIVFNKTEKTFMDTV
jgi:lipopolysaccharide transport system permease protein